jgi:pimeloyl-ACP methyl ester carboxylesterase
MMTTKAKADDGRDISFTDFGNKDDIAVLWCHGGPGSRLEPQTEAEAACAAGFRLIGIDRPGYGGSTELPGRQIADWAKDALQVADHLKIDHFFIVGVSTGGSYALATASIAPERVMGVIVCCGLSDMRWGQRKAALVSNALIWSTVDREQVQAFVIEDFGEDGSKMLEGDDLAALLSPPDLALLSDPAFAASFGNNEAFAQGVFGYVDDRIADGPTFGWSSFDINRVSCPVIVIHGEQDGIVPIVHGQHTADVVPNAELQTFPQHGHLSVIAEVVPTLKAIKPSLESAYAQIALNSGNNS